MGNLGVVPFARLRLRALPDFVSFRFITDFICFVCDAIYVLLENHGRIQRFEGGMLGFVDLRVKPYYTNFLCQFKEIGHDRLLAPCGKPDHHLGP